MTIGKDTHKRIENIMVYILSMQTYPSWLEGKSSLEWAWASPILPSALEWVCRRALNRRVLIPSKCFEVVCNLYWSRGSLRKWRRASCHCKEGELLIKVVTMERVGSFLNRWLPVAEMASLSNGVLVVVEGELLPWTTCHMRPASCYLICEYP